jgi:hypothetical protein
MIFTAFTSLVSRGENVFHTRSGFPVRISLAVILVMSSAAFSAEPFFDQTDVFISGTEGYHTFRIPSVVVSNKGTVLAFAESHTLHIFDSGDIDVCLKRSHDGGHTWGPAQGRMVGGPECLWWAHGRR